VIGGVITATILTLLVIPTFCEIMTERRDWLLVRLRPRRANAAGHARGQPIRPPAT
jgi:hypothetical protein